MTTTETHIVPANKIGPDRSYLGAHWLIDEALAWLPTALAHPTREAFCGYVEEQLHQNSRNSRHRYALYLANRYSEDGLMNLALARALTVFNDERIKREILFFETVFAMPFLRDITANWLAFQPETGGTNKDLKKFVVSRLPELKPKDIIRRTVSGLKKFRRLYFNKRGEYIPIWVEPPLEAFVYVLARLFPEPTLVPIEGFKASEQVRALLWQPAAIEPLLRRAEQAGYISRITQLDVYYQFAMSDSGQARLEQLFAQAAPTKTLVPVAEATPGKPAQMSLPYLEE